MPRGGELPSRLQDDLGRLPIVAENLGTITPDVENLRRAFGLPGMHIFHFAFDGTPENPHLPERHEEHGVAYTGTHDNDSTLGWFRSLDDVTRDRVLALTGGSASAIPWPAIRLVLGSRAARDRADTGLAVARCPSPNEPARSGLGQLDPAPCAACPDAGACRPDRRVRRDRRPQLLTDLLPA